jgi:hypothetical protein
MRRSPLGTAAALATLALVAACSDAGGPSSGGQVNFNLATKPTAASAASTGVLAAAFVGTPETYSDGTNTLVIDRVQLVLREIELKRVETVSCADGSGHDACERLEVGPILLDLPLGGSGGAARSFSVPVAAGTYDEVEFGIHKPSHDDDAAFVQANPDFNGVSVKVSGTYNGAPFVYTSDLEAEEEIELSPPLVTADGTPTDLTLFVDLDHWFRSGAGLLLDPLTANAGGANESIVESNIRATLHAFEDENEDGADDHGGHGTDD